MSVFAESPVDLPLPQSGRPRLKRYRWTETVETQRGTLGVNVDVMLTGPAALGGSGHFYLSAGPYWPATSSGLIGDLRGSPGLSSVALMVEDLCYECLLRYVELCGWAVVVSVTKSVAVMRGAFSPELLVSSNPWAFGPAEE